MLLLLLLLMLMLRKHWLSLVVKSRLRVKFRCHWMSHELRWDTVSVSVLRVHWLRVEDR